MKKYLILILLACGFIFTSCDKQETLKVSKPLFELTGNEDIPAFNGENAYQYIDKQVSFGPRNPGSSGHSQALDYLKIEMEKYADQVVLQSFSYPGYNETLNLTNITGKFNPSAKNRILLAAHWDTRPRAEEAKDTALQKNPVLGANDGASGVGVLLELARLLKENKPDFGIDIVFFDGEDYGHKNDLSNYSLGSKYFSANLPSGYVPAFAIVLDMVGDKDAVFPKEGNSLRYAPDVVAMVWGIAGQLGAGAFVNREATDIYDDHIPLNQAGIRTIDIIDLDLIGADTPAERRNYWHTEHDNMENIGVETLQQVGDVVSKLIYTLKFNS